MITAKRRAHFGNRRWSALPKVSQQRRHELRTNRARSRPSSATMMCAGAWWRPLVSALWSRWPIASRSMCRPASGTPHRGARPTRPLARAIRPAALW